MSKISTDSYIQNIINQLMPKLREYISSKGVNVLPNGFFSCIHPNHPDRNPSCSLGGKYNETVFHCFSQGHSGNIFTAAHWLEGMPIHDGNFYTETLVRLCEQFGIDYKPIELSDDAKRLNTRRQANNDALRTIQNSTFEVVDGEEKLKTSHSGIKFLLERGINEQTITNFKISVIDSNKSYLDAMIELGWQNKNDLQGYDLSNTNIFSANGFIIPIFDDNGMLVGFVTRNIRHSQGDKGTSKYYNTNNNDLYQKGSVLFNYNNVKKLSGPLYIVEGYLDAAYMVQEGIDKTVAVGSTVLSEKHIAMLAEDKNTELYICYDGDEGGIKGVELALERLSDYSSFNVKIIDLPNGYDPDTYIKEFGVEEFNNLPKQSPFSWTLRHAEWSADLSVVAQKAIPIIAAEQSAVVRVGMIKELSNFTTISETDIRKDVDNILSKEKDEYLRELGELNGFVVSQLQRKSIRETASIIKSAIQRIDHINDRYIIKTDTKNDFFDKINTFENKIIDGHFKYGLITSRKFKTLERLLDGIPYWANLMMFGGRPSSGKCMVKNTPILMFDGSIKMIQDIVVGDLLMGPDSMPRTVLSLARGQENLYNVNQIYGLNYGVNESHILSLKRSRNGRGKNPKVHHGDIINISVKDYLNKSNKFKNTYKGYKVAVDFPYKEVELDPYFLGLWLGDGSSSNTCIHNTDFEVVNFIKEYANKLNMDFKLHRYGNKCPYYNITDKNNFIKKQLNSLNVINNKHIPKDYILNTKEIRLQILAGLIDSDGYNNKGGSRGFEITQKNKLLAEQIKFLADTLGFRTSLKEVKKGIKSINFLGTYYRINISGNVWDIPTKIERKKISKTYKRDWTMNQIYVESAGYGDYYGFEIDGDHRYLLGDCTVTHNTSYITDLTLDLIKENDDLAVFFMSIDDSTELMLQKMVSCLSGLSVQQVKSVYSSGTKEQKEKFHEAVSFLKLNSERYIIADASQGNTLETFETHMGYFSKNFSGMKKLFILDNFHKLGNDGRKTEKKDILDDASSRIKTVSQSVDIPVMMSIELRKLANETDRPTRQDLQGTNKLDYDADLVALVHSDLMVNKETQLFHEVDFEGEKLKQPIIELNVCKNKINGEVDVLPFKFNRKSMSFSDCSKSEFNTKLSQSKSRVIKFGNTY